MQQALVLFTGFSPRSDAGSHCHSLVTPHRSNVCWFIFGFDLVRIEFTCCMASGHPFVTLVTWGSSVLFTWPNLAQTVTILVGLALSIFKGKIKI